MSWYSEVTNAPRSQIDWDAVRTQSRELNTNRDLNTVVSHVPKITPVKEGQQHPVGKHGQLKLFHEHVWPKGYTPQRMNEVVDATAGFVQTDLTSNHAAHLQNKIVQTMARSTVPAETLKILADRASLNVTKDSDEGEYDADAMEIRINPKVLGTATSIDRDGSGTVASQMTMHELGHLHDHLSDYNDFWKNNDRRDWYKNHQIMASPALEGRAEGFRLATNRITRGMRRWNQSILGPTAEYRSAGFSGPARGSFDINRLKSFRHASGQTPLPYITETPKIEKAPEKTPLPGMERFL